MEFVAIFATITTCVVSCFHAYLDYKRSKSKDDLWETAVRLALGPGKTSSPDDVVQFYEDLRFYKEHPVEVRRYNTISNARRALEEDTTELQQQ